jgi:hypothetical protein
MHHDQHDVRVPGTVNITWFVNLKTINNSQNEYKIFSLSMIGKCLFSVRKVAWMLVGEFMHQEPRGDEQAQGRVRLPKPRPGNPRRCGRERESATAVRASGRGSFCWQESMNGDERGSQRKGRLKDKEKAA